MFNWLKKKDKKEKNSNFSLGGVTQEAILGAYKNRYKEIESLRKYDRGEKEITPTDLRKIVRSI